MCKHMIVINVLVIGMLMTLLSGCSGLGDVSVAGDRPMIPRVVGDWWNVADNPDLGALQGPPADKPKTEQQPVDFAVWQAADGTWQLWSCIRHTKIGGNTRLFYGWQGQAITDRDWRPTGIQMTGDPQYGEQVGGMQAPHVVLYDGTYYMFYGDWVNICLARSDDGKHFQRWLDDSDKAGMFDEGEKGNARDACVLRVGDQWFCYYTAFPGWVGAVYCRTSEDMRRWSEPVIVSRGGQTGSGPGSAECPHVVYHDGYYYLFRTQRYEDPPTTSVYRSKDPLDFGVDSDEKFVGLLAVAAPEVVLHEGQYYIAALRPDLQGIRICRLRWDPAPQK